MLRLRLVRNRKNRDAARDVMRSVQRRDAEHGEPSVLNLLGLLDLQFLGLLREFVELQVKRPELLAARAAAKDVVRRAALRVELERRNRREDLPAAP